MKEEWSEAPFSEAVLVNPPARLERGTTYPFVDMAAVNRDSRSVYPSEERVFKGSGSRFQSGDTLMARITPCLENGKIARYQALEAKQEAHGSTEFIVIRGRPHVTDNDFAYYLTQWEEVRNYAIGQMTGTSGRQRVPVDSLDHLNVPLPSLPEQRAIAHILGTLDDKIELNRRMNRTLEDMARAIFQDWFVDFGPVRAKLEGREPYLPLELWDLFPDRLVGSALGKIPEGWEIKQLQEFATVVYGAAFASQRFNNSGKGLPLIRIRDLATHLRRPGAGRNGSTTLVKDCHLSASAMTLPSSPTSNTLKENSSSQETLLLEWMENSEHISGEGPRLGSTKGCATSSRTKASHDSFSLKP